MTTELKIVCPHCGYDHEKEISEGLDDWISDVPYETECQCGKILTVHPHITYSFSVAKTSDSYEQ